jgi:hypothetical protein
MMNQRPMYAFIAGIFLMFIGFSLKDLGKGRSHVLSDRKVSEEVIKTGSKTGAIIGFSMFGLGVALVVGSLIYTMRSYKEDK